MTDIVLSVHSAPEHSRSLLAYHYAQAALALGHRIRQVFFYQSGVLHGRLQSGQVAPVAADWLRLGEQHGFPLILCATVVEQDFQLSAEALHSGFALGGLTEFSMAAAQAERVLQF
ncbi:DsrE family protein [Pseudidiomarina insulisalsae]|uniref:DsrE family protein n=1 Tax=Pseudidiomarina insulisalsae TaxID=575789 RepID=UPI0013005ABF|nr:DsrE family protein [Pseudidiomarina insulisalsae]